MSYRWIPYRCPICKGLNLETDADWDENVIRVNEQKFEVPRDCDQLYCCTCNDYFLTVDGREKDIPL